MCSSFLSRLKPEEHDLCTSLAHQIAHQAPSLGQLLRSRAAELARKGGQADQFQASELFEMADDLDAAHREAIGLLEDAAV